MHQFPSLFCNLQDNKSLSKNTFYIFLGNSHGSCGHQIYECYAQFAQSADNVKPSDHLFHESGHFMIDSCRHRTVQVKAGANTIMAVGVNNQSSSGSCCLSNSDHFKWFNSNKQKCCKGEVKDQC